MALTHDASDTSDAPGNRKTAPNGRGYNTRRTDESHPYLMPSRM